MPWTFVLTVAQGDATVRRARCGKRGDYEAFERTVAGKN